MDHWGSKVCYLINLIQDGEEAKKPLPTSLFPLTSTDVGIIPKIFDILRR